MCVKGATHTAHTSHQSLLYLLDGVCYIEYMHNMYMYMYMYMYMFTRASHTNRHTNSLVA